MTTAFMGPEEPRVGLGLGGEQWRVMKGGLARRRCIVALMRMFEASEQPLRTRYEARPTKPKLLTLSNTDDMLGEPRVGPRTRPMLVSW